jgi:UDP-glucose:(heptosyl)LPS alpha-1,3-glucosyltransferase
MTERLRIAMVALDFHRQGGSEGRTGQLVDALLASGHEVHLVGARIRGKWDPRTIQHPLRTVSHPHWLEVLHFSQRAAALVEADRFDVIHNQIRPFVPGVVTVGGGSHRFYLQEVLPQEKGWARARLKRVSPLHLVLLALERRGFRIDRCPFIIANSCMSRDGILRYYPMPPERVVVAYNGVDADRFSPLQRGHFREQRRAALGIGPEDFFVLFVGAGFARKGLMPLLAAVSTLQGRGIRPRLVVVGAGRSGAWRSRAARLGLAERVTFVGPVPDPESYYAAADALALPTFFDPFANVTLEAMASGLPVVTSRRNGAAEILHTGVDGLVVDAADDVAGLSDALASLQDPTRRAVMGERARETALKYRWEGPLEKTLGVYRAVVDGSRTAGAQRRGGQG